MGKVVWRDEPGDTWAGMTNTPGNKVRPPGHWHLTLDRTEGKKPQIKKM